MKIKTKLFTVIFTSLLITLSCDKIESDITPNTFEEVLKQGGTFEEVPTERTTDILNEDEPGYSDVETTDTMDQPVTERWICTTKTLRVIDGNSDFPLFNTNADVIYPGNLLQGNSLTNATPSPIVVKRAAGTISYDLNTGNKNSKFDVDEVKKSSIQEAMNAIIEGSGDIVPSNFVLEIKQVQSEEELSMELGVKLETFVASASTNLSFSQEKSYNRFIVKLNQSFYTMSYDLPTSLDDLFHESVTPEQLNQYVGPENPATFISSVTYGRIFYMLIESTSSATEMQSKLNVSYQKFNNSVEGNLEVESMKKLKNLKIKIIAYGGDAKGSFSMAGETSVEAIANRLAESTDIRAGSPISYVVRSVERPDQIVGVKLATEYNVTNCELKGLLPPESYKPLVDVFDEEVGGIGAATQIAGSNIIVFNKPGTRYVWFNGTTGETSSPYSISDTNAPIRLSSFESIGAAVRFGDAKLYVFDNTGTKCEIFNYNPTNYTSTVIPETPIGDYNKNPDQTNRIYYVNDIFADTKNFQFVGYGFEAGVRYYTNDGSSSILHFFRKPGDKYAAYYPKDGGTWTNPIDTQGWGDGSLPFEQVGAACRIEFGDQSNTRQLFFNINGDEMSVWNPAKGFSTPWVIN